MPSTVEELIEVKCAKAQRKLEQCLAKQTQNASKKERGEQACAPLFERVLQCRAKVGVPEAVLKAHERCTRAVMSQGRRVVVLRATPPAKRYSHPPILPYEA